MVLQKKTITEKIMSALLDKNYASINEIMSKLRKYIAQQLSRIYGRISDPTERVWFRERMKKRRNQID